MSGRIGLTTTQRLLWTGQALHPDAPLYNMVQTFRIRGELDRARFDAAWDHVVRASDALRTTIHDDDGEPYQVVSSSPTSALDVVSMDGASDEELEHWVMRRAATPFDLESSLVDSALVRVADADHVWYLCQHHTITDGQSFALVFRAMSDAYEALDAGRPVALALEPFGDFVAHEIEYRDSDPGRAARSYWHDRIPAGRAAPEFYGRSSDGTTAARRVCFEVGARRSAALRSVAASEPYKALSIDVSLHAIWASLIATLLHRTTGREDVRIGTPFTGRASRTHRATIGALLEVGALDVTFEASPTFPELARDVTQQIMRGLRNARPGIGSASLNRSFDVVVNNVTARMGDFAGRPTTTRWDHPGAADAEQPLRIQITDFDGTGAYTVLFELNDAVFGEREQGWILTQFDVLLEAFLADPERSVGSFDLLDEHSRSQLIENYNDTDAWFPAGTFVEEFVAQVERTPDAIAVRHGSAATTYRELGHLADRMADRLREAGCRAESIVAIRMDRSLGALVALLGALRAGSAFLPLEPSHPTPRLITTLEDAAPTILLSDDPDDPIAPEGCPVLTVDIDQLASRPEPSVLPLPTPGDLAYMMYTSGSTGKPKGVEIPHLGLLKYAWWAAEDYQQNGPRTFPLYSSLAFDLTFSSIFPPLLRGGTIVVYPRSADRPGLEILDVFEDDQCDYVKLTPSHLGLVLEAGLASRRLERLMTLGEILPTDLARRAVERFGDHVEVINQYGPTEAVVGCTGHTYEPATDLDAAVPIGPPTDNTSIYLLDGYDQPVPHGVEGEMVIGGPAVARGYRNRPELNAERYGPDPINPGGRIYRTGDIARWNEAGVLEFIGRRDDQVKIRGARIELGEVESEAKRVDGVEAAAALAAPVGGSSEPRLVLFVVADDGTALEPRVVRDTMAERLPSTMLPDHVLVLDSLPINSNGKVDRKALPDPAELIGTGTSVDRAPGTDTERQLVALWSEVFDRPVGVGDNFFELGGDSITAIRMVARANAVGLEFSARDVFSSQTIATLAGAARVRTDSAPGPAAPDHHVLDAQEELAIKTMLAPDGLELVESAFALGPGQSGMLYHTIEQPSSGVYHQQITAELDATVDVSLLRSGFERLVARHGVLRSRFVWQQLDTPLQVVLREGTVAFEHHDWRDRSGVDRAVAEHRAERRASHFDLAVATPFSVSVVSGPDRLWLTIDSHHVLLDGWSSQILLRELDEMVAALHSGSEPVLRPVRPFADHASWLAGRSVEDVRAYWRSRLAGFDELTHLPIGGPARAELSYGALRRRVAADGLGHAAAAQRVTLNTVVQAAWGLVLGRYNRRDDVVFGTTVAGRPEQLLGVDDMVGMFINTAPTRVRLDSRTTAGAFLRQLQDDEVGARAHSDLWLADLQRDHGLPSGVPLFDSLVVFERVPGSEDHDDRSLGLTDVQYREQSNYPLALQVFPGDELELRAVYDADRFSEAAIDRLLAHVETALRGLLDDPGRTLGSIEILTDRERSGLPDLWTGDEMTVGDPEPVHAAFVRAAVDRPDAPAVVYGGERLTAGALDSWSAAIAADLAERGVGAGARVLVEATSTPAALASLLGVLRAGGAYLPVAPDTPSARIGAIAAEVGSAVVVGDLEVPGHHRIDPRSHRHRHVRPPDVSIPPDAPAYVITTSGSTGEPKGVEVLHRNIWHSNAARAGMYGEPPTRFLLVSPLAFDSSMVGLWWTLGGGGTIVLPPPERGLELQSLGAAIEADEVTDLLALPSLWGALLESIDPERLRSLRRVIVAGEAATPGLVALHYQIVPWAQLTNEYGPTEASVWSHAATLSADDAERTTVPIGRPIGGVCGAVVDHRGQPVPIGVPGELVLAGPTIASGYVGRPDETAARFSGLPALETATGHTRWYHTGDLVTLDERGTASFLGRIDRQVKVRGFRVELEEIEVVLASVDGVAAAAVVVTDGPSARLIGHVAGAVEPEAIANAVAERLPAHMVPSIVVHPQLPTTATGKLDRAALRAYEPADDRGADREPATPTECLLVELWRDLLDDDGLDVDADFFDAGGHSLLAMRLFARIQRETGRELPLSVLFEARTPARLALVLDGDPAISTAAGASLVPIRPRGRLRPFFYVSPYDISVLELDKVGRYLPADRPFYGLQPAGLVEGEEPHTDIESMARHYVGLLRAVQPVGPYLIGGHCEGGWVAYEMARQLQRAGEKVDYLGLIEIPPVERDAGGVLHGPERVLYYLRDRRLIYALAWQLRLRWQRWVVGRIGGAESRRVRRMREAAAGAFGSYEFTYDFDGPMHFLQSTEGEALDWVRAWYDVLSERSEETTFDVIESTHARLLMEPESAAVAAAIARRLDAADERSPDLG